MAEVDLAGYDDCDATYTEIAVDTAEHARQTLYHAVSVQRGQDWEEPGRWADLRSFLEQSGRRGLAFAQAAAQVVATDLEETDNRFLRVVYRVAQSATETLQQWSADGTTNAGVITAEGPAQSTDPIEEPPLTTYPPDPGPVPPGPRTIRGMAIDGGLFTYWNLGPNMGKFAYTVGLVCDMSIEWLYRGVQQRFPLVAEPDALAWIGRTHGLVRGLFEPEDGYRVRLSQWVQLWRRVGTPGAIAQAVQAYMTSPTGEVPRVHVVQHDPGAGGKPTRATWYTRGADGTEATTIVSPSNWDYDSADPARPASLDARDPRFWVIIEQSGPPTTIFPQRAQSLTETSDPTVASGFDAPEGYTVSPLDRHTVRAIDEMRSAGSWLGGAFFYFGVLSPSGSGAGYPDGGWHDPLNTAGTGARLTNPWGLIFVKRYAGTWLPPTNPYAGHVPVEVGSLPASPVPYF